MTAPTAITASPPGVPGYAGVYVTQAVERMKTNSVDRTAALERVRLIRAGKFSEVWPDAFSDRIPTSVVANFVDVAARDMAASLSPLPSLACSAGNMRRDSDKRRAERKNRIGSSYWRHSKLAQQMKWGADRYLTYGFLPFYVAPDFDAMMPVIHVEDPHGAFYDLDRWLDCQRYVRVWHQDVAELATMYPEYASLILKDKFGVRAEGRIEVVRYVDDIRCIIYLPERQGLVLASYLHKMSRCPVYIAVRPGLELEPRGQFDDVIFVQMAHSMMAALTLEAGHKAVQAPLAVPSDVNEISIGPDSVIVTDNPDKIQRVPLNVPSAAFALGAQLQEEMHTGAGYPDVRQGQGPAGGTTGRGVSALLGGYDTGIKLGQDILGLGLRIATELCFEMELALWPNRSKKISGVLSGESFELTYVAGKEFAEDTSCEVSFGFASGVSQNSMIVTLLQLRGDDIIGRDTFRRQLPFDIDTDQQQRELDVQHIEDALKQGLQAALTATGQMVATGQAPAAMQFFTAAIQIIEGRRKGEDLAQLFVTAFQPPPAPAGQPQMPGAPGAPGQPGGEGLPGVGPDGLPANTAPGQAGGNPGGRPSVQDLTASFTSNGGAQVGANVRRRVAIGG